MIKVILLVTFPIFAITAFSKTNSFVMDNGLEDIFWVSKNVELMAWYIGLDKFKELPQIFKIFAMVSIKYSFDCYLI